MSKKTAIKTNANDNQLYEDEFEEEFLKCKIEDIPIPKKELEDFQFEVKEVMKSGCNLQIAEYALIKCNIISLLNKLKEEYNKNKAEIRKKMEGILYDLFKNVKNYLKKFFDENKDNKENKKENLYYEEEANEIMEEYSDKIEMDENLTQSDLVSVKNYLLYEFEKNVENSEI